MFRYNDGGDIIEIIIRDNTGAKIDSYKFKLDNIKLANQILSTIKKKYGLGSSEKNIDRDIDWLKKNSSW